MSGHRPFGSWEMKANKMESLPGRNSLVWLILSLYCFPILSNWGSQFGLKKKQKQMFIQFSKCKASILKLSAINNLRMCLIITLCDFNNLL